MKRKEANNFPLEHLSASSISLLERNEKTWIRKYIYGEELFTTENMIFGREMADMFDDDVHIECILKRNGDKLKLIGKLDGKKRNIQFENKTSIKAWTQTQANNLFQLKIYALIHYKNTGKIPKQELHYKVTKKNNGALELTEKEGKFIVKQTIKDLLETEARVWKAYDKIIKITKKEYEKI